MKNTILTIAFVLIASLASFAQCAEDTAGQRAAFASLPVAEKARLWVAHLESALVTRKLDSDQRELINEGIRLVREKVWIVLPVAFDGQPIRGAKMDSEIEAFQRSLRANFSQKEGTEIFERLPEFKETAPVSGNAYLDCACSTVWTFCNTSGGCMTDVMCNKILNCGPFWGFECNGFCRELEPGNDLKRTSLTTKRRKH